MKVRPSVKPICDKCKIIKRKGKVMVICDAYPKHKQKARLMMRPDELSSGLTKAYEWESGVLSF